jgi:hypothetical protein
MAFSIRQALLQIVSHRMTEIDEPRACLASLRARFGTHLGFHDRFVVQSQER